MKTLEERLAQVEARLERIERLLPAMSAQITKGVSFGLFFRGNNRGQTTILLTRAGLTSHTHRKEKMGSDTINTGAVRNGI